MKRAYDFPSITNKVNLQIMANLYIDKQHGHHHHPQVYDQQMQGLARKPSWTASRVYSCGLFLPVYEGHALLAEVQKELVRVIDSGSMLAGKWAV